MSSPVNPPAQQPVELPPPPPQQPAPAKKSSGAVKRIVVFLVVAAVAAGGYWISRNWGSEASATKAGECVSITGSTTSPQFAKADCGKPEATHVVGKSLGTSGESCGGAYDEFTETLDGKPFAKLCLIPNMVEGSCFKDEVVSMDASTKTIDCGQPKAVKVVKVVKGSTDKAQCPAGSEGNVYPEPPTIHCLALAQPA